MNETLSTITTVDVTTVTVPTTRDLFAGAYVYGTNVDVGTKIDSITDLTTLELTVAAIASGTVNHLYTDLNPNQYLELCQAKKDVENVAEENGKYIQIIVRDEADVSRSDYRSIQKRAQTPSFWIKVYPIDYGPGTLTLEKAGLRGEADVSVWTPVRTWDTNGYDYNDIDLTRMTVKIDKETYEVKEKSKKVHLHNGFLYYTLGLFLK